MTRLKLVLALSLLGAAQGAMAEQFYKWTDANGVVQYSSTPPPKDAAAAAKAVTVSRGPTPVEPAAAVATDPAATATAATGQPADIKAENEKRQAEYKQKMCAYSQGQLTQSQQRGARRVVERRGNESSVALPSERAAEAAKWQAEVGKYCG